MGNETTFFLVTTTQAERIQAKIGGLTRVNLVNKKVEVGQVVNQGSYKFLKDLMNARTDVRKFRDKNPHYDVWVDSENDVMWDITA